MRMFEVVLILVNLLVLLLGFRKQSKAAWLWSVSINLLVFLIHGIFEGFRYQMFFSYIFVTLLVISALAKRDDKFHETKISKSLAVPGNPAHYRRIPWHRPPGQVWQSAGAFRKLHETKTRTVLKVMTGSLAVLFLAFTSTLAYALPVFTLPKPTGNYAVGIQYFHLVDENRTDPFLDTAPKNRELMVKVYYPAKQDFSKPFSRYFHGSSALIRSFAAFYNMPNFMFDHLRLVKTNSKEDLQLSDQQQSYPVVLFSHGAGTTMEVQTSQSEDLASHGYVVLAIDHTYASAATVFPDRVVSHKEATTDFNTPEPAEIITQIMADDAKFVIEQLGEMNEGSIDSIFRGRLNLDAIGAMGHSVGGAVAYNLAINDDRVKAAIDLDGVVFITPKEDPNDVAPFLMIASDTFHIQAIRDRKSLMQEFDDLTAEGQTILLSMYGSEEAYREAYTKAQQNVTGLTDVLKASGNLFTIEGSDHMKFTDIGLFIGASQLRDLIGIRGKTDPARCLEITNALTVAFFDQHLKGERSNPLESLVQKYQELKKVDLQ